MSVNVLVLSNPAARHLKVLSELPDSASVRIGTDLTYLTESAPQTDVILNGQFTGELLQRVFPLQRN